jgi:hypothetical protein
MFEILNQSTDNCLVAHLSGKLTGQEYQQFLGALHERMQKVDAVSMVLVLTGFEFYGDFEAAKQDFKFSFGEYKRVRRAAFVGDQKWIEWFTCLIGSMTPVDEKQFPEGQIQPAREWELA